MKTERLEPFVADYIWGGRKLIERFNVRTDKERAAEAWVLSMHKDGESLLSDGTPLSRAASKEDWGKNCERFGFFPVLIKLINAKDKLSVQVHPSDAYALENENSFGKTEMWYVMNAEPGAGLYVGFKEDTSKDKLYTYLKEGTILEKLNFFEVKRGDCFFITAGTVHAIGAGCTICEVQQNSNLTYRLYDYNRTGADGKPRQLHIEKAVEVADLKKYIKIPPRQDILASCEYFNAKLCRGDKKILRADSFTSIIALNDGGEIDGRELKAGESYFIPAGAEAVISGGAEFIEVYV